MKKLMSKKLPVFFHIPKNAGTFMIRQSLAVMKQHAAGRACWYIDVHQNDSSIFRFLYIGDPPTSGSYTKLNPICYKVDINDLDISDKNIFFVKVSDEGFRNYKETLYSILPEYIEPYEFIFLRDVYERVQSLYTYIQSPDSAHEPTHRAFGGKSFIEYLNSSQLEGSWLIRNIHNLPNNIAVTQEHFNKTCELLDNMRVYNTTETSTALAEVYKECYNIDTSNIKEQIYNKTANKIDVPFDSLDDQTQHAFLNQTKWDQLIYRRYIK